MQYTDIKPGQHWERINLDLFPPGFMTHPIHLHHDHTTDLTRAVVDRLFNSFDFGDL